MRRIVVNLKRTEDLLEQLKLRNVNYEEFLENNKDSFVEKDLSSFWAQVLNMCNMKNVDIINKADMGYTFFYDIISGRKIPSRDTIARMFIAMRLDLDSCQAALKLYNWAGLYSKDKRDSIVIYALTHDLTVSQTESMLAQHGEKGLKTV